jgi:flagellar basal-body rod protein FlgB
MNMNLDKTFGIQANALLVHSKRAEVLASNLANQNTPGYKARDFNFRAALQHFTAEAPWFGQELQYRIASQPSLDGNTVDGHVEQAEYAQNAMRYMANLSLIGAKIKHLTQAIKG